MTCRSLKTVSALFLSLSLVAVPIGCGDDGDTVLITGGGGELDVSTLPDEILGELDIETEIGEVLIFSPPRVTFSYKTVLDEPIIGLVPFWEDSNRYVRFTIDKLVPGQNGEPDTWVAYVRDATSGEPDYDTGSAFVDNGDGTYTFTFNTDIANVPGVPYEPGLTHRVAGQIGSRSVPLEPQNLWLDFVPSGGSVTDRRDIAVMESCNECHDDLVFHGRRFEVQYCVNCHNPDLAQGEGDMSFMTHRIHAAGDFAVLDNAISYAELTYPQQLENCRKCHNAVNPETPQGDNWLNVPSMMACSGCHDNFGPNAMNMHTGGPQADNSMCATCHNPVQIAEYHTTPNSTPNNPQLFPGQRDISYEMIDATVDGITNDVTIQFRLLSDGTALDVTNLPADMTDLAGDAFRLPGFLLAWAMPQDGILTPADWNNMGRRGAQPLSHNLSDFAPISLLGAIGTVSFNAVDGVTTAVITDGPSQFPVGATLRAVGLQNYFQQDLDTPPDGASDVSLHALSAVVAVTGDSARRNPIATVNCSSCHEWFEGHGGNRNLGFGSDNICIMCHVPNQSSSGRTVIDPTARGLDQDLAAAILDGTLSPLVDPNDPRTYPEDAQNFKDMIHGIHAADERDRAYQHVRGPTRQGYYDWEHITFPRGASTSNCTLCHLDGTYELPLPDDVLATTVRTTGQNDGQDPDLISAEAAFVGLPNGTDWVNTATASSCFYCHTSTDAWAHMSQNGGGLSIPPLGGIGPWTNRSTLGSTYESCSVCHGSGKTADVELVHNR